MEIRKFRKILIFTPLNSRKTSNCHVHIVYYVDVSLHFPPEIANGTAQQWNILFCSPKVFFI